MTARAAVPLWLGRAGSRSVAAPVLRSRTSGEAHFFTSEGRFRKARMAARLLFSALAFWALLGAAASAANETSVPPPGLVVPKSPGVPAGPQPTGASPTTASEASPPGLSGLGLPALHRALYVVLGLGGLGLLYYLGGRAFRTKKPPRKKYGLLSNSEDPMEMGSLESDEETVFETRNLRR